MKQQPSELFLSAIRRGYDNAATRYPHVQCTDIWDEVVFQCLRSPGGFRQMFAWDERKDNDKRNRIGTIADCIKDGLVPPLKMVRDDKGREYVEAA